MSPSVALTPSVNPPQLVGYRPTDVPRELVNRLILDVDHPDRIAHKGHKAFGVVDGQVSPRHGDLHLAFCNLRPILGADIDYDCTNITVYGPPPGSCPTLIKRLTAPSIPELTAETKPEPK